MKKAFTMIELIFVIVIIGILASVAIPKLAASRDDAIAAMCTSTAKQFIQEVSIYYTVYGDFSNISVMSYVRVDGADLGFESDIDFSVNSTIIL